ncbi:hypothetical protein BDZ45DRAFT_722676 [Acephala macrosclerotiorum]|nr:hypothetical protein BDZ45DRAFT_722676 [Acephala macrosclerotiorum]
MQQPPESMLKIFPAPNYVPTTVFFVISILADAKYLWIRYAYDIPVDTVPTGLKTVLGAQLTFALSCTLTKLSMLILVRRLLSSSTIFWRQVTLLSIIIVIKQGSVFCITVVFQCRPPQDYWKVTKDPQPNCINQASSLLVAGIINTLTDFLAVMLLFTFGFMSYGAGIARTYYMWQLYVGMIAASIPATKSFFTAHLPHLFDSSTSLQVKHVSKAQKRLQKHPRMEMVTFHAHSGEAISFERALRSARRETFARAESDGGESDYDSGSHIVITQTFDSERGTF